MALAQHNSVAGRLSFGRDGPQRQGSHNMGYVMRSNSSALTLRLVRPSSYTKSDIFDLDPSGAQAWSCWERGLGLPKMADFIRKSVIVGMVTTAYP